MKILLIADVHHKPFGSRKTLSKLKKLFKNTDFDLAVFLGDTIHGPNIKRNYEKYVDDVCAVTLNKPFTIIFGNHDDEKCPFDKSDIISYYKKHPNFIGSKDDRYSDYGDVRLIFIDSGSYCDSNISFYDYVKESQIDFIKKSAKGKRAIVFQHIITPDIMDLIDVSDTKKDGFVRDGDKYYKFKDDVKYSGTLGEKPCPPDFNSGELENIKDNVSAMVFGHDHLNDFEVNVSGVKFIQCGGAGQNSYDKKRKSTAKLLDTYTLETTTIYL